MAHDKDLYDPELGLNIIDLDHIYDVTMADNKAKITMALTSPGCPVGPEPMTSIPSSLAKYKEIEEVDLHVVFSPLCHPSMMSEEARDERGYFG
ncbi:MAG: metal-sulfur cluster assembly factor [Chloroflexota bacterium]|nr:metal-sulfur cluster assembly factor [Chloroflexota bacterium]